MLFRPLAPGEFDWERCVAAVLAGVGVLGALWLKLGLPVPGCVFFALTGWPCLTCGGTRAVRFLLRGEFGAAFSLNPLVGVCLCALAGFWVYAVCAVLGGARRIRFSAVSPGLRKGVLLVSGVLAGANWVYVVWRLRG